MSEEILTMFTNLYPYRHVLAGKPACVIPLFTALENIERILGGLQP
ncbi:MAG: hypothetical protein QXI48_03510 [Candidatus Bathyarchaeia archaeon]